MGDKTRRVNMKKAIAKKGQAIRLAKAARKAGNQAQVVRDEHRLSLKSPPTGFTMSVNDLAELTDSGRNQAYAAVRQGIYPSIRTARGTIKVLVVPTLQILRGERPPGQEGTLEAPPIRHQRKEVRPSD